MGWNINKTAKGFRFVSLKGKTFYSLREVKKFLAKDSPLVQSPLVAAIASSESESDTEFVPAEHPPSSSETDFSSPEKRMPPIPYGSYGIHKR